LTTQKHYFVGDDEVEKLLARGEGWLESHPERGLNRQRYLKGRRSLIKDALSKLVAEEETEPRWTMSASRTAEEAIEKPLRLHDVRLDYCRRYA